MICSATWPLKYQILSVGRLPLHLRVPNSTTFLALSKKKKKKRPPSSLTPRNFSSVMDRASSSSSAIMINSTALLSIRAVKYLILLINIFLIYSFRRPKRRGVSAVGSSEKGKGPSPPPLPTIPPGKSSVAARRALAVRRVMQEAAACEDCVREFWLFQTARGDTLFTQTWTPGAIKVRGVVVLLHGLNEHSGRYSDFAKRLNANGFKVYGMDWIGHGGSDGLHAYVHSLDDAVKDVKLFIEKVLAENPGLPVFCFGHSTGAAIILKAVLDPVVETHITGVVLTSPAVGVRPAHPIFPVLAPFFSLLLPKYQLSAANKKGIAVSRDPDALLAKYSDPLVYTGFIRVRTGYEILRITSYLQQNLRRLKVPFLVLHGSADAITDPEGSQKLYKEASSTDKSIKLYPGLLHDLLFEPEREEVIEDIVKWLNSRMQ